MPSIRPDSAGVHDRNAGPWLRRTLAETLTTIDDTLDIRSLLREGKHRPNDGWVHWSAVVEACELLAEHHPGASLSELCRRQIKIPLVPSQVKAIELVVGPHNLLRLIDRILARPLFPHMSYSFRRVERSTSVSVVKLTDGVESVAVWWVIHGALRQLFDRAGMVDAELRCEPEADQARFTLIAPGTNGIQRAVHGARRALTRRAWFESLVAETKALQAELERRQAAEALAVERAALARAAQEEVVAALAAEEELSRNTAALLEPHVDRLAMLAGQLSSAQQAQLEPELTELINGGVERLQLLLRGMQTWAALQAYEPQPQSVDISRECQTVIAALRPRYVPARVVRGPTKPAHAIVDRALVSRVVEALIDNALKFSSGEVVVDVAAGPLFVTIHVLDRGPGIPDAPAVMLAFRQGENGIGAVGAGLGLAIAQRSVDLLGGQLTLMRRPEGGTQARARLPISPTTLAGC